MIEPKPPHSPPTVETVADRSQKPILDPWQFPNRRRTFDMRVVIVTSLAAAIGLAAGLAAVVLLKLIGLVTNLSFYDRLSASFVSPAANQLGLLVLVVPVIGGVPVGLMARYGSEAICAASRSSEANFRSHCHRYEMSLWCGGPNYRNRRSDWLFRRPVSLDHC